MPAGTTLAPMSSTRMPAEANAQPNAIAPWPDRALFGAARLG
jgi:hypothetical protein